MVKWRKNWEGPPQEHIVIFLFDHGCPCSEKLRPEPPPARVGIQPIIGQTHKKMVKFMYKAQTRMVKMYFEVVTFRECI